MGATAQSCNPAARVGWCSHKALRESPGELLGGPGNLEPTPVDSNLDKSMGDLVEDVTRHCWHSPDCFDAGYCTNQLAARKHKAVIGSAQ